MKKQLFIAASTMALIMAATQVHAQGVEGSGSGTGNEAAPAASPGTGAGGAPEGLGNGRGSEEGLGNPRGPENAQPAEGAASRGAERLYFPAAGADRGQNCRRGQGRRRSASNK